MENAGEGTDEVRTSLGAYNLLSLPNVENLTALTDSAHDFRGNGSNNVVTGGGGNDFLSMQDGGNDTALGNGGNDVFLFGSSFNALDRVDGGSGTDQLVLQGNYTIAFTSDLISVESLAGRMISMPMRFRPGCRFNCWIAIDASPF